MSRDHLLIAVVVVVLVLVYLVPLALTAAKGKYGLVLLGILLHPAWWFGAVRLAKPQSFWARRFYGDQKMNDALQRHGAPRPLRERPRP